MKDPLSILDLWQTLAMWRANFMSSQTAHQSALENITRDAIPTSTADHQTANRLSLEVSDYLRQNHSPKDLKDLNGALTAAGLKADQISNLEKMGFPTVAINSDSPQHTTGLSHIAARAADRTNTGVQPEHSSSDTAMASGAGPTQTVDSLVHQVHAVEDRYHFTDRADQRTQNDLKQSLADIKRFCQEHPEKAGDLIHKLESEDLIGQLAIAALDQSAAGKSNQSLTLKDALQTFDGQGALGKAFQDHIAHAFTVAPGGKDFGSGYADAVRQANGREYLGATQNPDETPVITINHLHDLMSRFDHGPAYHGEATTGK